jgi:DNA processing protein
MLILYRVGVPLSVTLTRCAIAVAGTRDPTPWGKRLAREVGRGLAEAGYTVVTGFARGVDEETTLGALETGGHVIAILPYLFERDGRLNPRAVQLLRDAARRNALVSAVAENPVRDDRYVRAWLAMRNKTIVRMAVALVVPEARFKSARWGTRYAVEYALSTRRLVLAFKPQTRDNDVIKAYNYFKQRGVIAVESIDEVVNTVKRQCNYVIHRL